MAENKNNAQKLDLGLAAILKGNESRREAPSAPHGGRETSIVTLEDSAGQLEGEFAELARARSWSVLVSKAEISIASGNELEARLWWVRGHLGGLTLPVSLLAAPFETACRQLHNAGERERLLPLVRELGEVIVERLRDVGDVRQQASVHHALQSLGIVEVLKEKSAGWQMGTDSPTPSGQTEPKASRTHRGSDPRLRQGWRLRGGYIVGLVAVALLVIVSWFIVREPELGVASESFVIEQSAPQLQPPTLDAREVVGSLGALYYSLEDSKVPAESKKAAASQVPAGDASQAVRASAAEVRIEGLGSSAAAGGESVNTSGPIEGPDFLNGIDRKGPPVARLPDRHPDPQPPAIPSASHPDGSMVVAGEVKSVLVRTEVFSAPNYEARTLGTLEAGDRVSVEGSAGRWVRIRSRKGRAGYVFAQDIGELEDFRSGR